MPKLTRLRRIRESRFLSQDELAAKAGLARLTVIQLELGRAEARWSTARKLAEALGVEPGALVEPPEQTDRP